MPQYALQTVRFPVNNPAILQMTLFSIVADMTARRCRLKKNGPLGLAELMFLRSTPGRMGNLLILITAPRNQIGLRRFVIWG
jgi:hypothetical protein